MTEVRLLCWNVNGIRALLKKGFLEWLEKEEPDILCLQETKVSQDTVPGELVSPAGYNTYWNYAQKKGYSGVATFSKIEALRFEKSYGKPEFDIEGRVIITEHPGFTLFNVYFPNGKQGPERLKYKLDFYKAFLDHIEPLRRRGDKIVICGDVNTAHREIDLARPKENSKISGFLPVEREWIDGLISIGYVDTFRLFNREPGQYTWWDIKTGARARNVGWRIDYFFITGNLLKQTVRARILSEVTGSDHCPIELVLKA